MCSLKCVLGAHTKISIIAPSEVQVQVKSGCRVSKGGEISGRDPAAMATEGEATGEEPTKKQRGSKGFTQGRH